VGLFAAKEFRMYQHPSSGKGMKIFGILVTGIGLIWMVVNAMQTWPHNAIGYALGASNPLPTVQAFFFPGTTNESVLGQPSLSPQFIDAILQQAHSPAQGTGQSLYNLSKHYGIDDAYALAFFKHESRYGTTGIARLTLSLGNIRCSAGYQCIQGYRAYPNWQAGYADWYRLIATTYIAEWHLTTVEQIIPVYAPASDGNDVAGYIAAVKQAVMTWREGQAQA
jgi:hypothetical protein